MASKFSRSGVYASSVDYFCLVCECRLRDERDANAHVTKPVHIKSFEVTEYFEKNEDCVRKIDDSSFQCLTCNMVVALNEIDSHFNQNEHKDVYDSNSIFNSDYTKEDVELSNNEDNEKQNFTRPLDKIKNEVVNYTSKSDEAECLDQEKLIQQRVINKTENDIEEDTKQIELKEESKSLQLSSDLDTTKIGDVTCTTKSFIVINSSCEDDLQKNDEDESKNQESLIKSGNELETFLKENNMKCTYNKSKVYCNRCKIHIPSSLGNLKEHLAGLKHKSKANKPDMQIVQFEPKPELSEVNEEKLLKIRTISFVQSIIMVNGTQEDVILNEKICINVLSFSLAVPLHRNILKCLLCKTDFPLNKLKFHIKLSRHQKAIDELPVIIVDDDTEFLREVRPGNFHCGYCNLMQPSWDAMENHLQTTRHGENKDAEQWCLQERYMPQIRSDRLGKMHDLFFMQMLLGGMFQRRNRYYDSDSD